MTARPAESGFTLVELIVSLLVFGMIAGAGALLLATAVDAQARVGDRVERSSALRRAHALLAADLAQAQPRQWRDAAGSERPALSGSGAQLATLVGAVAIDPDRTERPAVQRIAWRFANGGLERVAVAGIDGAPAETVTRVVTGLTNARARYRGAEGWREGWPAADPAGLPRAVELTLTFDDGRAVVQRFMVAG